MRIHECSQCGRDGAIRRRYHLLLLVAFFIASCAAPDTRHQIVISTREQKLAVLDRGNLMAIYPVSTSKFGLGDWPGSYRTPLGELEVTQKIGDGATPATVFKDRRRTGEIDGGFARPRSNRHAHYLVAWVRTTKCECIRSRYLHSR